jgi:type VI secretion system protein
MYGLRIEHLQDGLPSLPGNGWVELDRELTVGRGKNNDLVLGDPSGSISKRHCTIINVEGKCVLVDCSRNGTFVNGSRQAVIKEEPVALAAGDVLQIGPYRLSLVVIAETSEPEGFLLPEDISLSERSLLGAVMRPSASPHDHSMFDMLPLTPETTTGFVSMSLSPEDSLMLSPTDQRSGTFTTVNRDEGSVTSMIYIQPRLSTEPIPDDWDLLADLGQVPASLHESQTPRSGGEDARQTLVRDDEAHSVPPETQLTEPDAAAALSAFFQGCGVEAPDLSRDDMCALLHCAGQALTVTISNLQNDVSQEGRLDLARALKQPESNLLRLTASSGTVLLSLLSPQLPGMLRAHEAIDQAFCELRQTGISANVALRDVLRGVLERIAPSTVERNTGESHVLLRRVSVLQQAECWRKYKAIYFDVLADVEARIGDGRTRGGMQISQPPPGS